MNAENEMNAVSSRETLLSSEETLQDVVDFDNHQCTCTVDSRELCLYCAIKEYQDILQNESDYSVKYKKSSKIGEEIVRVQKTDSHNPENRSCDLDSLSCENSKADLQCDQNSNTDKEFTQNFHTVFQLSPNCRTILQQTCNCPTNFEQAGNCDGVISFSQNLHVQNCFKDSDESQDSHAKWQQDPNCHALSQHFLNVRTVTCDMNSDSKESQNNHVSLVQFQGCHSVCQKDQNRHMDFQLENAVYINNESCDTDSDSTEIQNNYAYFPLIQNTDSDWQQQKQNCLADPQQENSVCMKNECNDDSDSNDSENSDTDWQKDQNCHADFQQENVSNIKTKPYDTDSDSNPSASESTKDSESYCDSLEHSTETCDGKSYSPNDSSKVEIKEKLDTDIDTEQSLQPNQDLKRSRRNSKRKRDLEEYCPVCGLTVRYSDLESHFDKEVENLSNIAKNIRRPRRGYKEKEGANLTFVQVKCNRENRLAAKVARYAKKDEICCPVCKEKLTGSETEINGHVLNCVGEDDDSDINITDHDETFEEYEFGDETRIRAVSLIPGGHRSLYGYSSKSKSANDEDVGDLNVDVDDTLAFGKPQYSELDVIHNMSSSSEEKEMEELRRAVIFDPATEPHVIECKKWSQNCEIRNEIAQITASVVNNIVQTNENEDSEKEDKDKDEEIVQKTELDIIKTLKDRIRDLEQQKNMKCLICLEPYTKPVVSTACWHVHCEECWLVSMGVKKLCPQCNMIVFPTDLRRIYL